MTVVRTLPVVCDSCRADLELHDDDIARCPNGCPGTELDCTPPPPLEGVVHLNYGDGRGEWVDLAALDMMDGTPCDRP